MIRLVQWFVRLCLLEEILNNLLVHFNQFALSQLFNQVDSVFFDPGTLHRLQNTHRHSTGLFCLLGLLQFNRVKILYPDLNLLALIDEASEEFITRRGIACYL